jgi:hypothetical protein
MKRFLLIILFLSIGVSINSCNKKPDFYNRKSIHLESYNETKEKLKLLNGLEIKKVQYVIANYQERPNQYDDYHLVDEAIFIELSNNQVISWIWTDDGPDEGYYYSLFLEDMSEPLKKRNQDGIKFLKEIGQYYPGIESKWVDVTETEEWKSYIGKKIESVNYKFTRTKDKRYHITDVILGIDNNKVYISSIEEPEPTILPKLENLNFAPDWTIVIFDEKILKKHERKSL